MARFREILWAKFVLTVIVVAGQVAADHRPSFRIIAPEFICGRNSSSPTADNSRQQLTIGLQTKGGQQLHYAVTINFVVLGGFVSQHHTVCLWRSVRLLERRLQKESEQISASNQFSIASDELVDGVMYTFSLVGTGQDGAASTEQNFTMTYRGKNGLGTAFEKDGTTSNEEVSLLLLGAEVTYADIEYVVTAKLVFCHPRNDYLFQWSVAGLDESEPSVGMERSERMRIPADTLVPGRSYDVRVTVKEMSGENAIIASARMNVTVLVRSPRWQLFPTEVIAGVGQPTWIYFYYSDMSKKIVWSCQEEGEGADCSDSVVEAGNVYALFHRPGTFTITATVAQNVSASMKIIVRPLLTASVKVIEVPSRPIIPGHRSALIVNVAGLVPNCVANWTVIKRDGYAYFDPVAVGGLGGAFVHDIEENFLSELVDYGNDTVSREVPLVIPAAHAGWSGLESNALYMFQLEVNCPEPINDQDDPRKKRKTVNSHWMAVLETNGPPEGLPLQITPTSSGIALKTVFTFTTGMAKDIDSDFPLKYSLWYTLEGAHINIGSYYEFTAADTVLPYNGGKPIATYYVVCDSREACSTVMGPTVVTLPYDALDQQEIDLQLDRINKYFERLNYRGALKSAFELLLTQKNQNSSTYQATYAAFKNILRPAINRMRDVYTSTVYLSEYAIQQFVQQAKLILDFEQSSNHDLFEMLVELLDHVPLDTGYESYDERTKRSPHAQQSHQNTDKINTKLNLMESMTRSSNGNASARAKTELLEFIHQAAKYYCDNDPHNAYVGQLLTLEVNRYRSLSPASLHNLDIPNGVKLQTGRSQFRKAFPSTDYFCLGRVYYARDLLTSKMETDYGFYEVFLLSVEQGGMWTIVDWHNEYFYWTLDGRRLPNVTCQLWAKDAWRANLCATTETATSIVHCNCSQSGYLRISNETEPELLTTMTTTTTTTSTTTVTEPSMSSDPTTQSDIALFPSTVSTEEVSSPAVVTAGKPAEHAMTTTVTVATTTPYPTVVISKSSEYIDPTTIATAQPSNPGQLRTNGTSDELRQPDEQQHRQKQHLVAAGPIEYSIIAALVFGLLFTTVAVVLYRRRKSTISLTEELHIIANRVRMQSPPVRYARFQDEHNMGGDNVSTISDSLTM